VVASVPFLFLVTPRDLSRPSSGTRRSTLKSKSIPPANNDTYYPIISSVSLVGSAIDCDRYRVGQDWYWYRDDVTSGDNEGNPNAAPPIPANWHMKWDLLNDAPGTLEIKYGTLAKYRAPDYEEDQDVRDITLRATADDFQRALPPPPGGPGGNDTFGADDDAQHADRTIHIWQMKVTVSQNGARSNNFSLTQQEQAALESRGGADLGWVEHGTPQNATGFRGNTEIMAAMPAAVPDCYTDVNSRPYKWKQQWKGTILSITGGVTTENTKQNFTDEGAPVVVDVDTRNPNGQGNNDTNQIFVQDMPGWETGATNDTGIANGETYRKHDSTHRNWVVLQSLDQNPNNDQRISNVGPEWQVYMELDVSAQNKWQVKAGTNHVPAN
jgi:hypothetical protein